MTVQAAAVQCSANDFDAFDLRAFAAPATIVKDARAEDVLIGRGRTAVRLSIHAGTLLDGPVRLVYKLAGRHQFARRLLALRQLEALMRLRRVPGSLAVPALDGDRPMMLLRTLDALAAHRTTRSVAIAVFGEDVVAADWGHESDYLRLRTRRLISAARRLAAGDYLGLLKGRR